MSTARDALEILVNLLYLIEMQSEDAAVTRTLVRQAAGPMQFLIDHCASPEEALEQAA